MSDDESNHRYPGFAIITTAKEKLKHDESTDGIIIKKSTKEFRLQIYDSGADSVNKFATLMDKNGTISIDDDDDDDSSDESITVITQPVKIGNNKTLNTPMPLATVCKYDHTSEYKLSIQEGFPLVDHHVANKDHGKYNKIASGGNKNDKAMDACFRSQIKDYPDPMCDCACPFIIHNIMRETTKASRKRWKGKFEKKYVAVLLFSFFFLLDDFAKGYTSQWYDIMIACFIGVPYIAMNAMLIVAEYSCICKAKSVYCCCHPEGCGNCCGLTCKKVRMCNADDPGWNCTRCETWDICLLCCRRKCVCLIVWACLCFKCGCNELCCHKCCPKKCCCGKDGNCGCGFVCGKTKVSNGRRLTANIFLNFIIPFMAVGFASVCAVFLDERLQNAVPIVIYWALEILTFPSVLFLTEIIFQFIFRRIFSCCDRSDKKEAKS